MSSDVDTQKRNLRPFARLGSATANGLLDGTTLVSLWDPTVPEGLNEGDDYWNDGQILILTGEMADQAREITDFVQATGVITVAPRLVNPAVSLLTVNSPLGDVVIDVADATVFPASGSLLAADVAAAAVAIAVEDVSNLRAGAAVISDDLGASEALLILAVVPATNLLVLAAGLGAAYLVANAAAISMAAAYIWDTAPNDEAVIITGIDLTLNQVTIAAPGIVAVAGYLIANDAALSMSPMILDTVQFVLMAPEIVAAVAGGMEVDLISILGAALTAANPVISGVFDAAGNRMPAGDDAARPIFIMPPPLLLLGEIFNTAVAANTDFFDPNLVPTRSPCTFRISVSLDAAGVLNVMRLQGIVEVTETLNENNVLAADCLYEFNITVTDDDDGINFQHSVGGTILSCKVVELYG